MFNSISIAEDKRCSNPRQFFNDGVGVSGFIWESDTLRKIEYTISQVKNEVKTGLIHLK